MNNAPCPDATDARARLASHGWIKANAENFRHLPPPALSVWLPDPSAKIAPTVGWTVKPWAPTMQDQYQAQYLDPTDPGQRATLFKGLPWPNESDAAHFGWVHRATCQRGLRLRIGEHGGSQPPSQETVQLVLRIEPPALFDAPLLVIEVAPGMHCVLLEQHDFDSDRAGGVQNLEVHIQLGRGAHLEHLRAVYPGSGDRLAHHIHVEMAEDAHYDQVLLASGSAYHLQRTRLDLKQPRSQARIGAALLVTNATLDHQVALSHTAANSHSAVEALLLAAGQTRAVLNAHTLIAPGSDEAAVRQCLSAIPTSGQPRVVLRPHMEIQHDQVQASHGATFGALPEEALFYARQRGLDEVGALALILEGLQTAVLERALENPEILQAMKLDDLLGRMTHQHLQQGQP